MSNEIFRLFSIIKKFHSWLIVNFLIKMFVDPRKPFLFCWRIFFFLLIQIEDFLLQTIRSSLLVSFNFRIKGVACNKRNSLGSCVGPSMKNQTTEAKLTTVLYCLLDKSLKWAEFLCLQSVEFGVQLCWNDFWPWEMTVHEKYNKKN